MTVQPVEDGLSIQLLGDLQVVGAGRPATLPASKRTRALLGYLVATSVPHTRAHVCDLLWDGPDDPRAALRWSLTKLRPIVNSLRVTRLEADRERIQFYARGAQVDVYQIRDLLSGDLASMNLPRLEQAATLLSRGEFLDGLDLPRCFRFHHWCMAERQRIGTLRRQVLEALIARLGSDPERALSYIRALVATDPLSEKAHALLVKSLAQNGRRRDAEAHYIYARDLLQRELAAPLTGALRPAVVSRQTANHESDNSNQAEPAHPGGVRIPPEGSSAIADLSDAEAPLTASKIVGHETARRKLEHALRSLATPAKRPMLLFLGEPGIGKTRLLKMAIEKAAATDANILSARCFEAETVRPYGIWVDAFRGVSLRSVPESIRQDLTFLQPVSQIKGREDRSRIGLFGAVASLLSELAREKPLVVALDDLQWIDEGSASLLHFVLRTLGLSRTLFVGAARIGEIEDNPWAKRLFQSLDRDCCPDKVSLAPLSREETAVLLGGSATEFEISSTYHDSGGNPLFIVELARARRRGSNISGQTLEMLIDERIDRLEAGIREVVLTAAVMGREFRPEVLSIVLDIPLAQLLERIERLERGGLVRGGLEGRFDFTHDLVRGVTYRRLSQQRRRLIHARIAAVLSQTAEQDDSVYGEIVHHAGLAKDYLLAARACVSAGNRCLRMFANSEAEQASDRGLVFLQQVAFSPERVRLEIALFNIKVQGAFHLFATSKPSTPQMTKLLKEIRRVADEAEVLGLAEDAALAHNSIAWLTWRSNDSDRARVATLEAERASRSADEATRCQHLANTARCLLDVEADIDRARRFLHEAASLAAKLNLHLVELEWGLGLVARWDGHLKLAHRHTNRALTLAKMRQNRWRETECLLWLAKIDLELHNYNAVLVRCDQIADLVNRIGEAAAPIARALASLAQQYIRSSNWDVDGYIRELRQFDDKANLAYFLNECASFELDQCATDLARAHSNEALAAAKAVRRPSDVAIAHAVLARIAKATDDKQGVRQHMSGLACLGNVQYLSARARSQIERTVSSLAIHYNDDSNEPPPSS